MKMILLKVVIIICYIFLTLLFSNNFPDSLLVNIPGGTFIMGELESEYQGPPGSYDSYLHTVTLNPFQMSITEISNEQYVNFLNQAYLNQLIEVYTETNPGPHMNDELVFGTTLAPIEYRYKALYNLSGTRVMKDHDNSDEDNDPFTGEIEPENPLNIAFIGFDQENEWFYVKNPQNILDFNWLELTNYYNYTNISHQEDSTILLNDYHAWDELENLPSLLEVKNWPAGFISWYGAKAFVLFYNIDLPTEAQWEYASKGTEGFIYATSDGNINGDGTSANWNYLIENPCKKHVLNIYHNNPNPFGIYNLAGNVWEWMEDWYDPEFYINTNEGIDPVNTSDTGLKVRRGGSWNYHQASLKTAARAKDEQFKGNDHFGFRVVNNNINDNDIELNENLKFKYKLFVNYPNPFNPITNIKYYLFEKTDITILVYDINGNLIKELFKGNQIAGTFDIVWNAHEIPSGLYIVKMETNDFMQTQKLILIK